MESVIEGVSIPGPERNLALDDEVNGVKEDQVEGFGDDVLCIQQSNYATVVTGFERGIDGSAVVGPISLSMDVAVLSSRW